MTTVESADRGSRRRGLPFFLREQWRNFTIPARRFDEPLDRQRANALLILSVGFLFLTLIGVTLLTVTGQSTLGPVVYALPASVLVLAIVIRGWLEGNRLRLATFVFIAVFYVIVLGSDVILGRGLSNNPIVIAELMLPVIIGGFLLGSRSTYGLATFSIAMMGLIGFREFTVTGTLDNPTTAAPLPDAVQSLVFGTIMLVLAAALTNVVVNSFQRLVDNAERQTTQLAAAALVAESAAAAPTLTTLLNQVVERIRDAFGFYHAQVFLLDEEGRLARLEASTGRAGIALLARAHALRVGSQSVIGQATFLGDPIVVNDTAFSDVWRPNELLPDTRAELALPLTVGGNVIGVLDVQSTEPDVFEPEDIRTLDIMAQQIATTIERARLLEELQTRAAENERLFSEAQRSLRQIDDLNRRLTREGWSDYLGAQRDDELGYTLASDEIRADHEWTAPMRQAYSGESSVVVRQDDQAHIAAVPLRVRGEVIGVLELQREGNRPWSDDDLEMAEALVERLGLAVENARLYEQATEATEREQIINRITEEVQAAETVDDVLRSALEELGNVLGASHGAVQLSTRLQNRAGN